MGSDDLTLLTDSELDRYRLYDLAQQELLDFLRSQMKKITSKNRLKQKVEEELYSRINPEDEDSESMSTVALLKLLEILSKTDSDDANSILSVLKENQKVIINNLMNNPDKDKNKKNDDNTDFDFSSDEIKKTKELIHLIDKLKESEFDPEELKK